MANYSDDDAERIRLRMLTQEAADAGSEVDRQQLQTMPHLGGGYSPEDVVRLSPENYPMAERRFQDVDPEVVRGGMDLSTPYDAQTEAIDRSLVRPPQDLSMEDQIAGRQALMMTPEEAYLSHALGTEVRNPGYVATIGARRAMYHGGGLNQMAQQRMAGAQRAMDREEMARQHDLQLFEKVLTNPKAPIMLEQLGQDPNFRLQKQAAYLHKAMKQEDYDFIGEMWEDMDPKDQERFKNGEMKYPEIHANVEFFRKEKLAEAGEKAKARALKKAMSLPKDQRSEFQQKLVDDAEAETEQKKLKNELTQSQINLNNRKTEHGDGPKTSQMTEEYALTMFDKPFVDLTQDQKDQVLKAKDKVLKGRTSAMIQGTELAAPLEKQNDYYDKASLQNLDLKPAPSGLTPQEYAKGPYRALDRKDVEGVIQFKTAVKTVDTMAKVADHLITAKTWQQAGKQWAELTAGAASGKNGLAAAYQADKNAFASKMARLVEVGVLTNVDVTRWADTFASFGDTVESMKVKRALFEEIQNETGNLYKQYLSGVSPDRLNRSKLDEILDKASTKLSKVGNTTETDLNILKGVR